MCNTCTGYNMQDGKLITEVKKLVETPFLGTVECTFTYNGFDNGIHKMSFAQKRIIKEFVDNHISNQKYVVTYFHVHTSRTFCGISIAYFPKNAHNTVYTERRKTIWVGRKGGIRKFTAQSSLGKEQNLKSIWHYYLKADD